MTEDQVYAVTVDRERERVSKVCFYGRLKKQLEIFIIALFLMAQETVQNRHHHQRLVSNLLEITIKANHHCRPNKSDRGLLLFLMKLERRQTLEKGLAESKKCKKLFCSLCLSIWGRRNSLFYNLYCAGVIRRIRLFCLRRD